MVICGTIDQRTVSRIMSRYADRVKFEIVYVRTLTSFIYYPTNTSIIKPKVALSVTFRRAVELVLMIFSIELKGMLK